MNSLEGNLKMDLPQDLPQDLSTAGREVYDNFVADSKGLNNAWEKLSSDGGNSFSECYKDYVTNGASFKESNPLEYNFIKDHIFYGKEFDEVGPIKTIYGDPEKWKDVLDWKQGDNDYNFQGDCGLVSCENILKKAGIDISETDIVGYAAENGLCNISPNPEHCGGTSAEDQAKILSNLGVPSEAQYNLSADSIAENIKDNHGVIIEVNAGVLWDDGRYYGSGESNHAITVTGVDIDSATNEVKGFYVCDSGRGNESDGARFISKDKMEDIFYCNGMSQAVITNNPL